MNNATPRPPVTSGHERLEGLIATAIGIKKNLALTLQNTRPSGEEESKGSVKSISRTIQDKMIDLQEVLDEIAALSHELDAHVGCHQDNQKVVQGRAA